jgi:hypothetical protein
MVVDRRASILELELPMPKDKNVPRFFLVTTEQEREIIKNEAKRRGMEDEESNILREALRLYFEKYGTQLPPGAFADRKRGNRLPKEDRLTTLNDQPVLIPG